MAPQANDVRDMLRRILLTERYKKYLRKYIQFSIHLALYAFNIGFVVVRQAFRETAVEQPLPVCCPS